MLARDDAVAATGLPNHHPLIRFALEPDNIDVALCLDDSTIWGALSLMAEAKNPLVSEFATRLRDRKLYKCIDVRAEVANVFDPLSKNAPETVGKIDRSCTNINEKLKDLLNEKRLEIPPLLIDEDERSPYRTEKGRSGPTERINVLTDGGSVVDLAERSRIVASLPSFKLFRVYYDCTNEKFLQRSKQIINDEIKTCP